MKLFRFIFKDRSLGYKFTLLAVVPVVLVTIFIVLNIVGSLERSMISMGIPIPDIIDNESEAVIGLEQ